MNFDDAFGQDVVIMLERLQKEFPMRASSGNWMSGRLLASAEWTQKSGWVCTPNVLQAGMNRPETEGWIVTDGTIPIQFICFWLFQLKAQWKIIGKF